MNAVYFAVGVVFSASALVLTVGIPLRAVFGLHDAISIKRIGRVCWIILICSLVMGYAYLMEVFMAYYSASKYEGAAFLPLTRWIPSMWHYWMMVFCNVLMPQVFWFKRARQNPWVVLAVSISVDIGMLYERSIAMASTWSAVPLEN